MQVQECAPGVYRVLDPDAHDWQEQDVAVYCYSVYYPKEIVTKRSLGQRRWACEWHRDAWEGNACEHIKAVMESVNVR